MSDENDSELRQRLAEAERILTLCRNEIMGTSNLSNEQAFAWKIKRDVGAYFGVSIDLLEGPRRQEWVAWPRQIAMHLVRECTTLSLPAIGEMFGNRDHGTVMYAQKHVRQRCDTEPRTALLIADLKSRYAKHEEDK